MQFFNRIPNNVKGFFFIISGFIVLFNTIGLSTQIMRTMIVIGSIGAIVFGIYIANIHTYIYKLLTQKDNNQTPPPQP